MNDVGVLKQEEAQGVAGAIEGYVGNVLSWALWELDEEAEQAAVKANSQRAAA